MSANLVAFVVTASALCGAAGAFRRWHHDGGDDVKWIRLCTMTGHGGLVTNVTVPCGVRVRGESTTTAAAAAAPEKGDGESTTVAADPEKGDGESTAAAAAPEKGDGDSGTVNGGPHSSDSAGLGATTTSATADGGGGAVGIDGDGEEYEHDDGVTVVEAQDDGVTAVGAQDDGVTAVETRDGGTSAVGETATDAETRWDDGRSEVASGVGATADGDLRAEEADGDTVTVVRDDRDGRQGHGVVAKAVLAYLLEARRRLHEKIHNLLNFLQHAFFNAKFNRRSRRNLAEQQMLVNGRRRGNIIKQSIASMITEPTFERSLMTMSFLMFGVFVIQVVQRLMQTLQQTG